MRTPHILRGVISLLILATVATGAVLKFTANDMLDYAPEFSNLYWPLLGLGTGVLLPCPHSCPH